MHNCAIPTIVAVAAILIGGLIVGAEESDELSVIKRSGHCPSFGAKELCQSK